MVNRIVGLEEAVGDIFDGATILVGGFGGAGCPLNLVQAASEVADRRGLRDLVIVVNSPSTSLMSWGSLGSVKKIVTSFALPTYSAWRKEPLREAILSGQVEVEVVPQGTLVERIRAGGAGIPAFFTPVGAGTAVEVGKEKRLLGGTECILESAIKGDFALIKADKADRRGNLVYRKSQRNFNPTMATAAKVTVAEVDEVVDELDPEMVVTPSIYVDRIVKVPKRSLDFRLTVRR